MSWLVTLTSQLGVNVSAALAASSIYAGANALERELRPEARQEIARVLKTMRMPSTPVVSDMIYRLFAETFGARHLSLKCLARSVSATAIFLISIGAFLYVKTGTITLFAHRYSVTLQIAAHTTTFFICCMIDYVSLWKSRILLRAMARREPRSVIVIFPIIDALSAFLILTLIMSLLLYTGGSYAEAVRANLGSWYEDLRHFGDKAAIGSVDVIIILSTMMTSAWTVAMLAAIWAVKISQAVPIVRGMTWLFNVDAHPVRVIGLMAAILVWTGYAIYGVI